MIRFFRAVAAAVRLRRDRAQFNYALDTAPSDIARSDLLAAWQISLRDPVETPAATRPSTSRIYVTEVNTPSI